MRYKGIELEEVTTEQIFNPPKQMLVWDMSTDIPVQIEVCAIVNRKTANRVITNNSSWRHCAEIPEVLATNRELARWLAEGNGEMRKDTCMATVYSFLSYDNSLANNPVCACIEVRKWSDTEWHRPTREYLGLED